MTGYSPTMVQVRSICMTARVAMLGTCPFLVSATAGERPSALRCTRVSVSACTPDGICIADRLIDRFSITFALKAKRYRSPVGTGRIHDEWNVPDGRHAIMTISPPAFAEFTFATDWRSASDGRGVSYSCQAVKG